MDIAFITLGCKVNQFATQAMERRARERGHLPVKFGQPAGACVINTCTVTATGDKKSRQAVRRARAAYPGGIIAVCGCYSQGAPEAAHSLGADVVAGTGDRLKLIEIIERATETRGKMCVVDDPASFTFEMMRAGSLEGRTRATLKIQDGCDNRCTYCAIPGVRGCARSLPYSDALAEGESAGREGYLELVLTGIEISSWGVDLKGEQGLAGLVEGVCRAGPGMRVRLGSLEPRIVTGEFCRKLAVLPNLCPHFHVSLQSGCDRTLAAMGRKYDTARYAQSIALLREHLPGCALTTDLIVGFPGESEQDFECTLRFIRRCAFASMHIFPYSKRPGTAACALPGHLSNAEKARRASAAASVAREMSAEYLGSITGHTLDVLFERSDGKCSRGHSQYHCEVEVSLPGLSGARRAVRVTGVRGGMLTGELV